MDTNTSARAISPAEIYEEQFVPALFRPFAGAVADAAHIESSSRVLDVACGTGALTAVAAQRAGASGSVFGLDCNAAMLTVARRKPLAVQWIEGCAEVLPFADGEFDAVVSQFGLMFFDDRAQALREMQRVLRPGGRLAVAVCDAVEHSPGYAALAGLLLRLFGRRVADAFRAPFAIGDPELLRSLCARAGLLQAQIATVPATVRFASIDTLVSAERSCVWTLGGLLDDSQFERLLVEARRELQPFVKNDEVVFKMPALLITAGASM